MATPRFNIKEITEGQALGYLTLNEALQLLDFLAQPVLLGMATDDPPTTPANGDAYVIGTGTGAWTGEDDNIALWLGGWRFLTAKKGIVAWDDAATKPVVHNGTIWKEITLV